MPRFRREMLKHTLLLGAISVTIGCSGGASAPTEPLASSTIVGDFGGDQVVLHATSSGVEIQFSCMAVDVSKPLTTDAAGHFTATGARHRTGGAISIDGEPTTLVRLDGHAYLSRGETLQLVIADIPEETGAPIGWAD